MYIQKGAHPIIQKGDAPLISRVLHLKNKSSRRKCEFAPLPSGAAEPGYAPGLLLENYFATVRRFYTCKTFLESQIVLENVEYSAN